MSGLRGVRAALIGNYGALAVALVAQIVLLPMLLSRLGAAESGSFVLLWSAVNFAGTSIGFLSSGAVVVMTRGVAEGDASVVKAVYRHFVRVMGGGTALVWVVLVLWSLGIGTFWLKSASPEQAASLRLASHAAGLYLLTIQLHQGDLGLLTAHLEQGRVALYRVVLQTLMLALALVSIRLGGGVASVFGAYAAAALLVALTCHVGVRRRGWLDASIAGASGSFGQGSFASYSLVYSVLQYVDLALLSVLAGPATVVLHTFLMRLPDAAILLIGRGSETLGPYYTTLKGRDDAAALRATFITSGRVISRLAAVAAVGYAVFGPDLVRWWSRGQLTLPSPWYFAGAGVVIAMTAINRNGALLSYYTGGVLASTRLLVIELCLRMLAVLVLFPTLGIAATVTAAVAAQGLYLAVAYRRLEARILVVRLRDLFVGCLQPALVTALLSAIVMLAARTLAGDVQSRRVLAVAAGSAAAVALLAVQERALAGRFLLRRQPA